MGEDETYTYDLNGNLKTKIDRNDTLFTQTYDGLNRLTLRVAENDANIHTTSYQYYQVGLVKEVNDNGYIESFEYDDRGFIKQHNYPNYHNSYTYDVSGNVKKVLSFKGIYPIQVANYTYDELDRMITVSDMNEVQATYTYDSNGNRTDLDYLNGSFGADYTYNLANRVVSINNFNDDTPSSLSNPLTNVLPDFAYKYQLNGSQVSETETVSGIVKNYTYDELNRLVNEAKSMNGYVPEAMDTLTGSENVPNLYEDYSIGYTFDDYGNILTKVDGKKTSTYTYDKNNRIITESDDVNGDLTIKSYSYDKNGNTISERTEVYSQIASSLGSSLTDQAENVKIYEYNILSQLVKSSTPKGITFYTYDASGLRATKSDDLKVTTFFWNGQNIIGEDVDGVITAG